MANIAAKMLKSENRSMITLICDLLNLYNSKCKDY